jgi:two-component system phosphate regulon sensor histidine kinase PhoR
MSESIMTGLDFRVRPSLRPPAALGAVSLAAGTAVLTAFALAHTAPLAAVVGAAVLALAGAGLLCWVLIGAAAGAAARPSAADRVSALAPPYVLVLESLPDPVMLTAGPADSGAAATRVLFANAAARELFRLPRQDQVLAAVIRNPVVLETLEQAFLLRAQAEAEFEEGGPLERMWRVVAKPLPDEQGLRRVLLWLRDETDARHNERTRADFLANASHELRTPLASLSGFIETLRGHAKDDAAARDRFLAIMSQQAGRMSRLIDDLLSLSRIELNEHIAPSGEVDLAFAVTDVLDALGPVAADRGAVLHSLLPGKEEAVVTGDRDQIVQVVQNLVDNALKYAGSQGQVEVEVKTDVSAEEAILPRDPAASRQTLLSPAHASDARYALVRISDSGPGIARQNLPRLSERFFRVEGQKSGGERSGTGLGLAIVKHIINRHRGGLMVESLEGHGASFTAYFPRARDNS